MKISHTKINHLVIEGIDGDYIYETIKKENRFYENDLLVKWLPYIQTAQVLLDIGANLGNHTIFWSQTVSCKKIYSFEPFPANFDRLSHNIENNHIENVIAVNAGCGQKRGYTSVKEFHEDNYGGTTLDTDIQAEGSIEILDIDSFTDMNHTGTVDFVKIDTEGYEESVLAGMQNLLQKDRPDVWIEVSSQSFRNVLGRFRELGYVLVDVSGFNMLFLYPDRHSDIRKVDEIVLLEALFHNLGRVNQYYRNYMTAKEWIADKETRIATLAEQLDKTSTLLDATNKKYQGALENYETAKTWVTAKDQRLREAQAAYEALDQKLNRKLDEEKSRVSSMTDRLCDCLRDYETTVANMEQLVKEVTRLRIQNERLLLENNEQERKLNIVRNNIFGKIGMRAYKLYKRYLKR